MSENNQLEDCFYAAVFYKKLKDVDLQFEMRNWLIFKHFAKKWAIVLLFKNPYCSLNKMSKKKT